MEFSNPGIGQWLFNQPWLDERVDLIDALAEKQWSADQATRLHSDGLIADVQRATGAVADYVRGAKNVAIWNDAPNGAPLDSVDDPLGSLVGPPRAPYALESEYLALQRREQKARAALAKFSAESKSSPGRKSWATVQAEAKTLITELAMRNAHVEPYELKAKPSRPKMLDSGRVANAAHAERRKVEEARPDIDTARAMLRGSLRAKSSLHVSVTSYALAKAAHLPLIDLRWGHGRTIPAPEDVSAMLLWLANERIEDELMQQLEQQYSAFADRSIPALTEQERRHELARADEAIHAAELEEAAHLLGIIGAEGTLMMPPARMSARALLGVV